jgi:hypothetical protein
MREFVKREIEFQKNCFEMDDILLSMKILWIFMIEPFVWVAKEGLRMSTKLSGFIGLSLLFAVLSFSQTPNPQLLIGQSPLPPVTGISAIYTGPVGGLTYYYYVVARYEVGNAQVSPAFVLNNVNASGSVVINVTPPASPTGYALTYDYLRSTSNQLPATCNCLISGNTASLSVTDTLGALSSYTINSYAPPSPENSLILSLDNTNSSAVFLKGILNGTQIFTSSSSNLTLPLSIANGGTGTATPALVAGTNVTITGSFPNQTINASGGTGNPCITTALSFQYNAAGSFGCISNLTWTSATGVHNLSQLANTNDTIVFARATDTTPSGYYFRGYNNAKNTVLSSLDVNGNYIGSSFGSQSASNAGYFYVTAGTAPASFAANSFTIYAPASITSWQLIPSATVPTTLHALECTTAGTVCTITDSGVAIPAASGSAVLTQTIQSGSQALGTSLITSGACASTITISATNVAATDDIMMDFNASPLATTGYQASANGMLTILKWPSAGNVNIAVCNNTSASITPGAVTVNWRVVR